MTPDGPEGATLPYLECALNNFGFAFTVSDPRQADNPVVFASPQFYELTGILLLPPSLSLSLSTLSLSLPLSPLLTSLPFPSLPSCRVQL